MKPAQKFILLFVALLFIVLTLLRLMQSDRQPSEKTQAVSQQSPIVLPKPKANNNNPFGASSAVVSSTVNSDVIAIEQPINPTCDEFDEDYYQALSQAFDEQLTDDAKEQLLLLTVLEGLTPPIDAQNDSDEYKAYQEQLRLNRLELLKADYQASKRPLAAIKLLDMCITSKAKGVCSETLIEQIINENSDNGFIWLFAITHYEQSDNTQLESALNSLLNANEFTLYRKQFFLEIYDFFTTQGLRPLDAYVVTMGFEAARWYPFTGVSSYCRDNNYPENCLMIGEYLEKNGNLLISREVGLAFQSKYWEERGSKEIAEEILGRKQVNYPEFSYQWPLSDEAVSIYLKSLDYEKEEDWLLLLKEEFGRYINENPDVCVM